MKKLVVIISISLLAQPSQALLPEASDLKARAETTWLQVKKTVKQWWNDFNGEKPANPEQSKEKQIAKQPAPQQPTSVPATVDPEAVTQPTAAPTPIARPDFAPLEKPSTEDSTLEEIKKARTEAKKQKAFAVSEKGRPADPNLQKTKAGVPTISAAQLKQIQRIPVLNVGREDRVSKADFTLPQLRWTGLSPKDVKALPTAVLLNQKDLAKVVGQKFLKVAPERKLQANMKPMGKAITLAEIQAFKYPIQTAPEIKLLPYTPLSAEQIKMVAALILFQKGTHCHMVMGLMNELKDSKSTKHEALYHLGACADQLKMTEAEFAALGTILKDPKNEFTSEALEMLAKDLPKDLEQPFYMIVKEIPDLDKLVKDSAKGPVYYRMAKGAYKAKHFNRTHQNAAKVPEASEYWGEAQYLATLGFFSAGKKKQAFEKLVALEEEMTKKGMKDSNLRAVVNASLARMKFLRGDPEGALPLYLKVPKDHGLWVQALIEQGWVQLSQDDFSGAIGNMYSLHSPYFKIVYQPESFVVRTIGYLNICQYGDAYRTLSKLETDYREFNSKVNNYLTATNQPNKVYESVRGYIKGKSTSDVDGLPYQVLREAARGKAFLNLQTSINEKTDEVVRYEGVNTKIKDEKASIRNNERNAKKRFDQLRTKIAAASKSKELAKNLDEYNRGLKYEKDLVVGYRFQLAILEQSRQGYLKFQEKSQAEVNKTKSVLTSDASGWLMSRLKEIKTEMSRVLENNEFLRYEVFSGSGENIRYQVAGGQVSGENRIPASIKPQKALNWSFDGEFWEDEIGNYRSSLVNNCPQTTSPEVNASGQAMNSKGEE